MTASMEQKLAERKRMTHRSRLRRDVLLEMHHEYLPSRRYIVGVPHVDLPYNGPPYVHADDANRLCSDIVVLSEGFPLPFTEVVLYICSFVFATYWRCLTRVLSMQQTILAFCPSTVVLVLTGYFVTIACSELFHPRPILILVFFQVTTFHFNLKRAWERTHKEKTSLHPVALSPS